MATGTGSFDVFARNASDELAHKAFRGGTGGAPRPPAIVKDIMDPPPLGYRKSLTRQRNRLAQVTRLERA